MLGWIVRILLVIAGFITSFFIAYDALNFEIIKMVVAILIFTVTVMIAAFWPMLKKAYMQKRNKNKKS